VRLRLPGTSTRPFQVRIQVQVVLINCAVIRRASSGDGGRGAKEGRVRLGKCSAGQASGRARTVVFAHGRMCDCFMLIPV
jgi:hypothetical protein